MISNYRNEHGVNKWWHAIFYELLDINLINAYIIYKEVRNLSNISQKEFRIMIVTALREKYPRSKRGRKPMNSK